MLGTRVQVGPTAAVTIDWVALTVLSAADVGSFLLTDVQPIATGVAVETPVPTQLTRLGRNYPNPFRPSTSIPLHLDRAREGRVAVHAIDGRLVRTLARGILPSGATTLRWDGRDQAGRRVASGVYLVRLTGPGVREARPITLLR